MGFWIFMLIMDLLLPFTMIGFGRYFMKKAPKEINSVFGYRTSMSMKNKDTWEFAHKYCGKVWYVCGMVMLPITVIFMLLVIGKNEDCVGSIGGIICGVQLIPLIGSILPTEIALKKNFDKNGTRRYIPIFLILQIGIWRYYGQEKVLANPIVLCAFYNVRICCNTSLWNNKCSQLIW